MVTITINSKFRNFPKTPKLPHSTPNYLTTMCSQHSGLFCQEGRDIGRYVSMVTGWRAVAYLELVFEVGGVALGVYADHVIVCSFELAGRDGRLPAETRLQDGVMDEDVLLLRPEHT